MIDTAIIQGEYALILDDREDVLTSAKEYIESANWNVFTAKSISEASNILIKDSDRISSAFIDYKLDKESGISFILDNKERYPKITFYLITAWEIDEDEANILIRNNIATFDKAKFNSQFFIDQKVRPFVDTSKKRNKNKSVVTLDYFHDFTLLSQSELKELYFTEKMKSDMKDIKIDKMNETWSKFIHPLLTVLQKDKNPDVQKIYIGNEEYSVNDLIRELKDQGPIGQYLLELHNSIVDDLMSMRVTQKVSKWSIKNLVLGFRLK